MTPTAISERQLDKVEQKLQKSFCRARQASLVTYKVCYLAPSSQGDRLLQSIQKTRILKISMELCQLFIGFGDKNVPKEGFFVKFNASRRFRIFNSDLF